MPDAWYSIEPEERLEGPRPQTPAERKSFAAPSHDSLSFPFVAGRAELAVRLKARPLFDLRRRARVGVHLSRTLSRASPSSGPFGGGKPRLEPGDILKLDSATLARGLELHGHAEPEAITVPVCWSTAATSRGRFALMYAGLQREPDAGRVLLEIVGLPPAAPVEEVAVAVSHIEAQERGVLVRAPADLEVASSLARAGVKGLSIDLTGLPFDTPMGLSRLRRLIGGACAGQSALLVLGLPAALAEEAAEAGATHAVMEERIAITV